LPVSNGASWSLPDAGAADLPVSNGAGSSLPDAVAADSPVSNGTGWSPGYARAADSPVCIGARSSLGHARAAAMHGQPIRHLHRWARWSSLAFGRSLRHFPESTRRRSDPAISFLFFRFAGSACSFLYASSFAAGTSSLRQRMPHCDRASPVSMASRISSSIFCKCQHYRQPKILMP
jgi:hypothetical protein